MLVIDGGMGSELEARGAPMDHEAWCGLANLERPTSCARSTTTTSAPGPT